MIPFPLSIILGHNIRNTSNYISINMLLKQANVLKQYIIYSSRYSFISLNLIWPKYDYEQKTMFYNVMYHIWFFKILLKFNPLYIQKCHIRYTRGICKNLYAYLIMKNIWSTLLSFLYLLLWIYWNSYFSIYPGCC